VRRTACLLATLLALVGSPVAAVPEGPGDGTPEWYERELGNFLMTQQEHLRELTSPEFQLRLAEQTIANGLDYELFQLENHFVNYGNLCRQWGESCLGDPFQYPGFDPFWGDVGGFTETLFYDRDCGRISSRVWYPLDAQPGDDLPGIVITNGSVQASETLYWWAAQALVEAGYVVMTWDPRGQGRSDTVTPDGRLGTNFNSAVFWNGTVDAIDFFRSSPNEPYPHNATCAAAVATNPAWALVYDLPDAAPFNPHHDLVDLERLGLAGHSLGATGVTRVQAMDPWEGLLDQDNPVDVIVAWDALRTGEGVTPRVPAMGHTSEYGLTPMPFQESPDPEGHTGAHDAWVEAGQPVFQFTVRGSSHYEWSLIPSRPIPEFSSTSWLDWGNPMAEHYTVAWFDRWLKRPGEPGWDTADERLLDDNRFCERLSFYFRSARSFPTRDGAIQDSDDIRASCLARAGGAVDRVGDPDGAAPPSADDTSGPTPTTGGGAAGLAVVVVLLGLAATRRKAGVVRR